MSNPCMTTAKKDELPQGWIVTTIKNVTEIVENYNPEKEKARSFGYIDISCICSKKHEISEYKMFKGIDAPSRARRPIRYNDILFSTVRTYLRNIAIVPEDIPAQICSTGFTVLRPNEAVISKFLFYTVITDDFIDRVTPKQTGTHYPATSDKVVKAEKILLPPLNEQRRIVAKLEKLLAKVDACKQRLEKIPTILARFRQSVLAAACSGRLTADWREQNPDIEPASELLKQIQDERQRHYDEECAKAKAEGRRRPKAPSERGRNVELNTEKQIFYTTWSLCQLRHLFSVETGATPHRKSNVYYDLGTVPWVKTGELKNCDIYDAEELITELAIAETNAKIFPFDTILIAMYGEGKTRGQVGRLKINAATNQACAALVNANLTKTVNDYIYMFCLSQYHEMRSKASGGNQPNLNLDKIKHWIVPLPPLAEQQEIVRRVESLFQKGDRIELGYQKAKAQIDQLEQSILAKAFRGELVPQDPNDEPASVLLDRIREERAKEQKAKTAKKSPKKTSKATGKRGRKKAKPAEKADEDSSEPTQLKLPGFE